MKAMILAAGLGTRLRPLTLEKAKPAVPLLGIPLILRIAERLLTLNVTGFRLNLHHLPHTIESIFAQAPGNRFPVSFSYEPEILGTAGGLKANEEFFSDDTFLMVNGDIVTDFPLEEAIAFHKDRGASATLILMEQEEPYRYHPVRIDRDHRLRGFKGAHPGGELRPEAYVFTGVHILEPDIFSYIKPSCFFEINDRAYPAAMNDGRTVLGYPVNGYWNDIGTPQRYLQAHSDLFAREFAPDRVIVGNHCDISDEARVGPSVAVGAGCSVEPGAIIRNSILWERVHVEQGAIIENSIVASDVTVRGECIDTILTVNGEAPIVFD